MREPYPAPAGVGIDVAERQRQHRLHPRHIRAQRRLQPFAEVGRLSQRIARERGKRYANRIFALRIGRGMLSG